MMMKAIYSISDDYNSKNSLIFLCIQMGSVNLLTIYNRNLSLEIY